MKLTDIDKARRQARPGRILTIDIERLPGLAYVWEPRTRYIPPDAFKEWPRMICWAARWYGQSRVMFEAEWKNRDRMIERAWELYDQADAVITYNGVTFDNRHLRSDWITAGYPPPRPWKDIDLLREVRKKFGWESKSLDQVAKRFNAPGKVDRYNRQMALAAVAGDREAQKRVRLYNVGDVEVTEFVHDALTGWMNDYPHLGTQSEQACNQCGSTELHEQPTKYRAVVLSYRMYRCESCGGLVRSSWSDARLAVTRGVKS